MTASPAGRATALGAVAVLLWSALALLTTAAGPVPPFLLTALTFAVAFAAALAVWLVQGGSILARFRWPSGVWALGVGGLFGYHLLYFLALRAAPPVEANLVNYLWPLLIVLLSALLPGERLRWWHVAGALLGLAGAALLVTGGGAVAFRAEHGPGYAAAAGSALVWAAYSVASRRFGAIPSEAVGAFYGVTAALAFLCHLAWEPWGPPAGTVWPAVVALGIGPMGIAFFVWDIGMKHGDIRLLGALAYLAPLLSTLLLLAFGRAPASWTVAAACVLIAGGAALAARDRLARAQPAARRSRSAPSRR
ncbi:MAG: EamA family transporter [Alphaproteobacteria bacterium]|nr:EamA family transporter [Alphaproteobacteria bacterium]